jgi:hypothetical protein
MVGHAFRLRIKTPMKRPIGGFTKFSNTLAVYISRWFIKIRMTRTTGTGKQV